MNDTKYSGTFNVVHTPEPREWCCWHNGPITLREQRLATIACETDSPIAYLRSCELYRDLPYADREARIDMLLQWLEVGGLYVAPRLELNSPGDESKRRPGRQTPKVTLAEAVTL